MKATITGYLVPFSMVRAFRVLLGSIWLFGFLSSGKCEPEAELDKLDSQKVFNTSPPKKTKKKKQLCSRVSWN